MTDDLQDRPIHGKEADECRQMLREWHQFKTTDKDTLSKIAWMVRNWKMFALAAIIGAAGSMKNILETVKVWLS